jgi:hypothetical protein
VTMIVIMIIMETDAKHLRSLVGNVRRSKVVWLRIRHTYPSALVAGTGAGCRDRPFLLKPSSPTCRSELGTVIGAAIQNG